MSRPRALQPIQPRYTEPARKAGVQGTVIVEAIIDEKGYVTNVRVVRGLPMGSTAPPWRRSSRSPSSRR